MFESCFERVEAFKKKFPGTVCWRIKRHSEVIEKHLNPNEKLLFAFAAQLNEGKWHLFDTAIIALTSERIIIGHKGLIYGYNFITVTPDMYNDLTIKAGLIWGTIVIDTVKEQITISNIDKNALPEIETYITSFMEEAKKQYARREKKGK
ncbi:MAG: PH domain-containing protein [Bacilli bacterium]|nr:PH domain-containing protein [Bacilli bacterium]